MKAKLWMPKAHGYADIEVDDQCNWKPLDNLSQVIACPSCGRKIKYGNSYVSTEYFSGNGIWGMRVCLECYLKEPERWNMGKDKCQ